jgi:hypothetical protein
MKNRPIKHWSRSLIPILRSPRSPLSHDRKAVRQNVQRERVLSWVPHPPVLRVRLLIYARVPTSLHPVWAVALSSNAVAEIFPFRHYALASSEASRSRSIRKSCHPERSFFFGSSTENVFANVRPELDKSIRSHPAQNSGDHPQ